MHFQFVSFMNLDPSVSEVVGWLSGSIPMVKVKGIFVTGNEGP
jgi:hypothetical protein